MRLPATLEYRRSPTLIAVVTAAHLLAAAGLLAIDVHVAGKLLALPILVWSLLTMVRRAPVGALALGGDGRLTLIRGDGGDCDCAVDPSTTVLPWLIVLRLRTAQGLLSLTLPVDALGADGHRRLRVWLKWKATSATA
jgi:hypothetical protein